MGQAPRQRPVSERDEAAALAAAERDKAAALVAAERDEAAAKVAAELVKKADDAAVVGADTNAVVHDLLSAMESKETNADLRHQLLQSQKKVKKTRAALAFFLESPVRLFGNDQAGN